MFQPNGAPALGVYDERIAANRLKALGKVADAIHTVGEKEVDFPQLVEILARAYRVKNLLIEGGGQINFAMFRENLMDEIYLTLSPRVIRRARCSNACRGERDSTLPIWSNLELLDHQVVGDEIFLHYRVCS